MARRRILLSAALLVAAAIGSTGIALGAPPPADVHVTVHTHSSIGIVPPIAFGLNASAYDGHLLDPGIPQLIRQAGVTIMRYPGGSEADAYHWQDNSITPGQGGYANPNDTFDNFMKVVSRAGTKTMITVNYGSSHDGTAGGDPHEAAGWVQYANKGGFGYTGPVPSYVGASPTGHRYGIKYWEIGNELYGNGTYGAHWETDLHPDAIQGGPEAYGQHAVEFITAMKAVDPSIKVGVVLMAPGNWPDEDVLHNAGTPQAWNDNVIKATCARLDFADVHWYPQDPGNESDAALLQSPANGISGRTDSIPQMVSRLRAELAQYCPSRADQIQIMITETNSVSYNPGKQTVSLVNALFASDSYMTWLENGVTNIDWWQLHNNPVLGTNNSTSLYGTANFGDYGILSSGQAPEPAANTPFPPYYGLEMLKHLGRPDDRMVQSTSDNPLVAVHAVKQDNGNVAVLLINKDPNASHTVKMTLPGYVSQPVALVYSYGENSTAITTSIAGHLPGMLRQTVAPYSLTTVVFTPR